MTLHAAQSHPHLLRLPGIALLLAAAIPAAIAQAPVPAAAAPPPGNYSIAGTVINAITGGPVSRATVAVLSEGDSHTVASVQAGIDGHFELERLPAAKYQLTASKRGFRTAFYDEHDDFSSAIVTGEGQNTTSLTFRLTPGALLHGDVSGDGGDPVEGARVMLFQKPHAHRLGERIVQMDATTTDDTGAYEFGNLAAGEYLLAVTAEPWYALHRPSPGMGAKPASDSVAALDVAYPVTYFDSTTEEAAATPIVLSPGGSEEARISLRAVQALHLVVDTPAKADGSITRPELRQSIFGTQISAASVGPFDPSANSRVEFTGVSPGHYELAQGDPQRIVELDATTSQEVNADAGTPAISVSGTLRADSGAALPEQMDLILTWLDGGSGRDQIQTIARKGQFRFDSVPAGAWELWASSAGKNLPVVSIATGSAAHAGSLVTVRDRPLSLAVTVSHAETRIEGFARKDGKGFAGAMIVLVPRDLAAYRALARRDQSDSDGSFALRDVPPGDYTVVAIEDAWEIDWAQTSVIRRYLPRGVAVTIPDKPAKLISLSEPVPVQQR
jgi:hypothetical protein